ncbi:hypothetical protein E4U34_000226 [Claviceps purpurea]|nr:hypothetical protein E4U34_000226 [Claviceps purpurea]
MLEAGAGRIRSHVVVIIWDEEEASLAPVESHYVYLQIVLLEQYPRLDAFRISRQGNSTNRMQGHWIPALSE